MVDFYGTPPTISSYVVGKIFEIRETVGYFVKLLEYNDMEAFIPLKEASRVRFKKLSSIVKVGVVEVFQIILMDDKFIDLSRKYLDEDRVKETMEKYTKFKKMYDWMAHTDTFAGDLKLEYIRVVLHGKNEVPDHLLALHDTLQVICNCQETPIVHTTELCLHIPTSFSVNSVNAFLETLRVKYDVTMTAKNTREMLFYIGCNSPCLRKDFERLISEIEKEECQHIDESSSPTTKHTIPIESQQPICNIGIIGHVAHGKTTIVQALTGVDTRKHKKEMVSNRTLKLGYTNIHVTKCECSGEAHYVTQGTCDCPKIVASIVDCPGHSILLNTMISGAHIMDTALLLVAANERCPQIQTREHVDVFQMIKNPKHMVVLQNKIDIVNQEVAQEHKESIEKFFRDNEMTPYILPVSAQKKVNVEYILRYIYEYAASHQKKKQFNKSYGVIVRSFDTNKPGTQEIKGAVIGGSILEGSFSINDEIILLPKKLKTKIYQIRSDDTELQTANSGGLIALQTSVNPVWCNMLIGNIFVPVSEYDPQKFMEKGTEITVKIYILKTATIKKLKPLSCIVLNNMGKEVECEIISSNKNRFLVRLRSDIYCINGIESIVIYNGRLLGYAVGVDKNSSYNTGESDEIDVDLPNYHELYALFQNYQERNPVEKTIVQKPITVYKHTFTTITNFEKVCLSIYSSISQVSRFVFDELGARSYSINGQNQMVIKGCISERQIMTVLRSFIINKLCSSCKKLDTSEFKENHVKKIKCNVCGYSEVKRA